MKVVQDAINSGDYQQLNEQVRKTVSASVQEVYNMGGKLQNGFKEGTRQAGNGLQEGFKEGTRPRSGSGKKPGESREVPDGEKLR